ncbi:putative tRNA nucleotidyltransferase [Drechmeria coniospora]|uniref:Putative tRNA nucleotidyltransferase n=1 Tax=Drechmeria coniospora TaxID=98403 RepID=A0A151GHV9_DRECN|nr:putative tRNA nucleotidyltransferase [Drechmeria coniospora]KYK56705.1 putative tRNA nucleotidyltransferase [Drechmeria coniospora]
MIGPRSINLNPREQKLRSLLLDVCRSIDSAGDIGQPLVLRWAGGWVRDKLLGIESNDIDVAINAMTGIQFAQRMCDFCTTPAAIETHEIGDHDVGNLHNVSRNPDKSKHLETTMVKIFGLDVDFVNLRKETYADDSRNPLMEFGSPKEDALRRDATINALFYNLNTGFVEDFTSGLADMTACTIRTPLDPLQTFTDDPLRVLRLCLDYLLRNDNPESVGSRLVRSSDSLYLAWSLAAVSPWMTVDDPPNHSRKANSLPPVAIVAREGFKAPNKLTDVMAASHRHRKEILELKRVVCSKGPTMNRRDIFGMAIRRWEAHGGHWTLQVLSALLVEAMDQVEPRDDRGFHIDTSGPGCGAFCSSADRLDRNEDPSRESRETFIVGWESFVNHLVEIDVYDAPAIQRLVDGRSLAKALSTKPGRWTGKGLEICMEWQLRNPLVTDPQGAIDEVRKRWIELDGPSPHT